MPRRGSPDHGRPVGRRRAPRRGPARRRAHPALRAGVSCARLRPPRPHVAAPSGPRLVRQRGRPRPARARPRLRATARRGVDPSARRCGCNAPRWPSWPRRGVARAGTPRSGSWSGIATPASMVATELRAAAQRCESLRDNLWYLVDAKVATAIAVDERARHHQQQWLAAAAAVTTGAGDRAAAEPMVREQIGPYVDEDIANDWLTAMRSTVAGVATSYDMVIDRMAARRRRPSSFPATCGWAANRSAATECAGIARRLHARGQPSRPGGATEPSGRRALLRPLPLRRRRRRSGARRRVTRWARPRATWAAAWAAWAAWPGLAGRIVDAMGGLLGSSADGASGADPLGEDAFDDGEPFHPDEVEEPDEATESDEKKESRRKEGGRRDGGSRTEGSRYRRPAPPAGAPPPRPPGPRRSVSRLRRPIRWHATGAPAPVVAPTPAGGPAPPGGEEVSTPCEIAADQLPQAGR